jgi:hypothetical protein
VFDITLTAEMTWPHAHATLVPTFFVSSLPALSYFALQYTSIWRSAHLLLLLVLIDEADTRQGPGARPHKPPDTIQAAIGADDIVVIAIQSRWNVNERSQGIVNHHLADAETMFKKDSGSKETDGLGTTNGLRRRLGPA